MKYLIVLLGGLLLIPQVGFGQGSNQGTKFEQLGTTLPTPNSYRNASGAPGKDYWQQKADYVIQATLNESNHSISGTEKITYFNQSPDDLRYLWMQLDQNMRAADSDTKAIKGGQMRDTVSTAFVRSITGDPDFDGGHKIDAVTDALGNPLSYTINKTMMRIDLPKALASGDKVAFNVKWHFTINDRMKEGGRSGYELFPKDGNAVYTIAQWFPRMCVYDDLEGWQNKQFLGRGEFALAFGDYEVSLTVPSDHIVASTGSLQNPSDVLSSKQRTLFETAKTATEPVMIVTQDEAIAKESKPATGTKTWVYHADNVRDFAFATSRKFIWDAMGVQIGENRPMAMSYYPKEGNPLWEKESTWAVAKTLETYSKYTIDYPYPVAISVHAASIGMEYPMICFNFGRPNEDGSYSDRTKYGMIGVVIHEVGHNFFPMIINSDERQWTWMDEGLNSFVQYLVQVEQYENFPHRRGPAKNIVNYMKGDKSFIKPIMTNSEQIFQFGNNAYGKPATALNILRETVMGPELFDFAFKEYSTRWAFKHPSPGDFFRTMEDASGVDLDWFWKGWFYTTDHVDIELADVNWYRSDSKKPQLENKLADDGKALSSKKKGKSNAADEIEEVKDFSNNYKQFSVSNKSPRAYGEFMNRLDDNAIKQRSEGKNFYELTLKNNGGLVMPVIIEWTFTDGSKEVEKIPAEIWRINEGEVTKVFVKDKEVVNISLDPFEETADIETTNNHFPKREAESKFDQFKTGKR